MKTCRKCETSKAFDLFSNNKTQPDGKAVQCKTCHAAYYQANIEKRRLYTENYRKSAAFKPYVHSPEQLGRMRANANEWHANNRDKALARMAVRRETYPEKVSSGKRIHRQANKPAGRAETSRRRVAHRKAVPDWSSKAAVKAFYESADVLNMLTGEWYHVDHIVPLQSKIVCGLHNEFNLQILTAKENMKKGNRFWPDMPTRTKAGV